MPELFANFTREAQEGRWNKNIQEKVGLSQTLQTSVTKHSLSFTPPTFDHFKPVFLFTINIHPLWIRSKMNRDRGQGWRRTSMNNSSLARLAQTWKVELPRPGMHYCFIQLDFPWTGRRMIELNLFSNRNLTLIILCQPILEVFRLGLWRLKGCYTIKG